MSELEEFSALVGDIYDASLDPTLWSGVFSSWAPEATVPATHHGVTGENTFSHHRA
jgi:hypothetical protein